MDALATLFDQLKKNKLTQGHFRGFLQVLIGRTIVQTEGLAVISKGKSWRDLAGWLKRVRWDPEAVRELGLEPDDLPLRDRQRYWYSAIAQAKIDSASASEAGDLFVAVLQKLGYDVVPHV